MSGFELSYWAKRQNESAVLIPPAPSLSLKGQGFPQHPFARLLLQQTSLLQKTSSLLTSNSFAKVT
jgi:hypothetical protein